MTRTDDIAKAKELREAGLSYREIGERLGVHMSTARRWLDPEAAHRDLAPARAYKARNREAIRVYNRHYNKTHKGKCSKCGGMADRKNDGGTCLICRSEEADSRAGKIECWWAEGLTLKQIAAELGWTVTHVTVEINSLRGRGYDLPYRRAHAVPRFPEQVAARRIAICNAKAPAPSATAWGMDTEVPPCRNQP